MYVRANGRDVTTEIDSNPDFVLRTINMTLSKDNGTVVASFVQSGRCPNWKKNGFINFFFEKVYSNGNSLLYHTFSIDLHLKNANASAKQNRF